MQTLYRKLTIFASAIVLFLVAFVCGQAQAQEKAHDMGEPLLWSIEAKRIEIFKPVDDLGSPSNFRWDTQADWGNDINKLALRYKGEQVDGDTSESSLQLVGAHAFSTFWDVHYGIADQTWLQMGESRRSVVVGVAGLAPYFLHVESHVYLGPSSQARWTFDIEKEWLISQRLSVATSLEGLASLKRDISNNLDSGANRLEWSLSLQYQIARELVPYVSLRREQWFGKDVAGMPREDETHLALGMHIWY